METVEVDRHSVGRFLTMETMDLNKRISKFSFRILT